MKISDAIQLLTDLFRYNLEQYEKGNDVDTFLIPYFEGPPGVGKTAATKAAAKMLDVPYFLTIIANMDAGELGGFGIPTDVIFEEEDGSEYTEKRVIRARPDYMPDPRSGGSIGFWNLDELPQAFLSHQNICSQLFNQWRIGEHPISHGITMVATGNRPEDKAGTTPMPQHLKDRLMFISLDVDYDDFNAYAAAKGLHPFVRAYLGKYRSHLHKFEVGAKASPNPRSWEKASSILWIGSGNHIRNECLQGTIGDGMTSDFIRFITIEDRMPDPQDVLRNPDTVPVFGNEDADVLYMLIAQLVEIADTKTIEPICNYVSRLPNGEFKAMFSDDLQRRHPKLQENKFVTQFKLRELPKVL